MILRPVYVALTIALVAAAGCSSDTKAETSTTTSTPTPTTGVTGVTGAPTDAGDRVVVRGNATLDGAPFDARFLGAVVRSGSLMTPCQASLPPVTSGRYEIGVLAETAASGCGAPGSEVLLWTFVNDKKLYSSEAVAWPENGRTANFDPSFSVAAPNGAARAVSEFSGEIFDRSNQRLPAGAKVEAFVGDTLCGVASTCGAGNFSGYILAVVGPDSVPGCARDGTVTFRVDGRPVRETAVNRLVPAAPGSGGSLDLLVL